MMLPQPSMVPSVISGHRGFSWGHDSFARFQMVHTGDAPSPRSMRCERLGAEGSVRSLYLWCDVRGKATCLIGPLQSHWAGSG